MHENPADETPYPEGPGPLGCGCLLLMVLGIVGAITAIMAFYTR